MMMNRTKSVVVDALVKLRFKCIPTSTRSFSKTPFSDLQKGFESARRPPTSNRSFAEYVDLDKMVWEDRSSFVDEFTHLIEVVTKHAHDDFSKKNCVSFITSLLHALVFEHRVHEAYALFNKLIEFKLCEPNTLMYNTVIKALCNNCYDETMMDDAVKLFQEMVSQPDVVTYTSLVSGFCKMRRWTKATLLLKEMIDKDISPDMDTFNVLINTFCVEGRFQVARHVIYMMHERGISPNIATYNSLIDGYCLKGKMDEARSLFNLVVSSHLAPDTTTYTSLLNAYCKDDKMDDTMLIYHEMNEKGFKPNCATYNRMIQSCFSDARFQDAHKILNDMLAQGQTLNTCTYCDILHDLFLRERRFEEVLSLFHLLGEDNKLNSDMSVLDTLMGGAIKCGKLDFARELFEGLSVRGIEPEPHIYDTMISGFFEEGFVNDAKRLFLEMEENHCWPDTDTYNCLLQGYLRNKCYDDVNMLLYKMMRPRHYLYESTWSMLHDSVEAGSLDATLSVLINKLRDS